MDNFVALLTSGLVGGFIGTFLGGFSKFFWEHWLPDRLTWQRDQRVRQRQLLATHRDPAVRAINELQSRLWVTLETRASNYHYVKKHGRPEYYIHSSAFMVAQYFAWSELMRREIAALDYSDLSRLLERVTDAFSHGGPGFQFFALEQREIGERLMGAAKSDSGIAIFRYSDSRDLIAAAEMPKSLQNLQKQTKQLFDDIDDPVVQERATKIQHALIDLLDFIDPDHRWVRGERRNKFSPETGDAGTNEPAEARH